MAVPADLRKDAGGFDLPIALGMLTATHQLPAESLREFAVLGELALDGSLRRIKGVLSMAMAAAAKLATLNDDELAALR
jgi:magnesium chelatase family protein